MTQAVGTELNLLDAGAATGAILMSPSSGPNAQGAAYQMKAAAWMQAMRNAGVAVQPDLINSTGALLPSQQQSLVAADPEFKMTFDLSGLPQRSITTIPTPSVPVAVPTQEQIKSATALPSTQDRSIAMASEEPADPVSASDDSATKVNPPRHSAIEKAILQQNTPPADGMAQAADSMVLAQPGTSMNIQAPAPETADAPAVPPAPDSLDIAGAARLASPAPSGSTSPSAQSGLAELSFYKETSSPQAANGVFQDSAATENTMAQKVPAPTGQPARAGASETKINNLQAGDALQPETDSSAVLRSSVGTKEGTGDDSLSALLNPQSNADNTPGTRSESGSGTRSGSHSAKRMTQPAAQIDSSDSTAPRAAVDIHAVNRAERMAVPVPAQHARQDNSASLGDAGLPVQAASLHLGALRHDTDGRIASPDASARAAARDPFPALDSNAGASSAVWTHAGAQQAEAGFDDPSLGWVSVRANLQNGEVHASITASSSESASALGGAVAGLSGHLAEQHIPVESVTVASAPTERLDLGNSMQQGSGGQQPQDNDRRPPADSNSPFSSPRNTVVAEPGRAISAPSNTGTGRHVSVRV